MILSCWDHDGGRHEVSIDDIQQGIHKALGTLPHDSIVRARTLLDEAATALAEATAGSEDASLHETLAHYHRTRDDLDHALSVFAHVHTTCSDYLTSIGALPADTAPPPQPAPVPARPEAPPLHPHLDEHVFQAHIRYKQFTGYHFRPGGMDTGDITVGETRPPDEAGCYQASATAVTRSGKKMTKPKTFFPDHWTTEEVRQAIRSAFTNRQPVRDSEGVIKPGTWQGTHREVIIEGKLFHGTDFDTATLDDVGTAYPIVTESPERPEP